MNPMASSSESAARPGAAAGPDDQTIANAYLYLLGRALVIRQERHDLAEAGVQYNAIKYNPLGSADFVNPNFDVAYLEAWIAVDAATPALLEVPAIAGRYYTAQILDEWAEVIVNVNERTFPSRPSGTFALLAPGSTASGPQDAGAIFLHSNKAKMLARVELKGDPDGAVALQQAFKLRSTGSPVIAQPPAMPDFDNQNLIGVEIFDNLDATLASALDVAPNAAEMQQQARAVAAHAASSPQARAVVDAKVRQVAAEFRDNVLLKSAPYVNHWLCPNVGGNYGSHYGQRTATNYTGIWANTPAEVVYFAAMRDAEDKPLNGSNSYVMHFAADKLPESIVNAYWSVILVGVPDYRVVPNPLNRFNVNSYSPLQKDADGSLKLAFGPQPVAGVPEANWLPSAEGEPFSLTFRAYVPKEPARQAEWTPPALQRVAAEG
jgi:hypothetical protein